MEGSNRPLRVLGNGEPQTVKSSQRAKRNVAPEVQRAFLPTWEEKLQGAGRSTLQQFSTRIWLAGPPSGSKCWEGKLNPA